MSLRIDGYAWITPLGADPSDVWERWMRGEVGESKVVQNPASGRSHTYLSVPPNLVAALGRTPRLRRSSAISYYAVAAGLAAMKNAGLELNPETAAKTAVVFAICDGGVFYTRRFYDQIVNEGAHAASPLLFPETVYNAPASHLASQLGIDGASYTLVGDASVGMSALHFAGQLLATHEIDQCLVVGAEECDWVLCEAYRDWRLTRTPLAEGAAALLLKRTGRLSLVTHPGAPFFSRRQAPTAIGKVLADLARNGPAQVAVCSANRSFVDAAEAGAIARHFPEARALYPKRSFGEAPGAGALIQTVAAALAVEQNLATTALVSVLGFNQQAGGALVTSVID